MLTWVGVRSESEKGFDVPCCRGKRGCRMAKHELDFTKERETKNTIRYQEDAKPGQPQVIGTLYIQKWAGPPDKLKVVIEW